MLYDGALRYMELGKEGMEEKNLQKQNDYLQKAQRLVMELMSCLNMKDGEDVAKNLLALYTYVLNQLVEANVQDKTAPIERAMRVMNDLRGSWVEIEKSSKTGNPGEERLAS